MSAAASSRGRPPSFRSCRSAGALFVFALLLCGPPRAAVAAIDLPDDTLRVTTWLRRGDPTLDVPVNNSGTQTVQVIVGRPATPVLDFRGESPWRNLPPGPDTLRIPIDNWNRVAGTYSGTLHLFSQLAEVGGDSVAFQVDLRVAPPQLDYAPHALEIRIDAPGSDGVTNLLLHNAGTEPLTYDLVALPAWLEAAPRTGSVPEDSTAAILLTLRAADLSYGAHAGDIEFQTNAPGNPVVRLPVTLRIGAAPPHAPAGAAAADDSCPDDTYCDGTRGTVHTTATTLEDSGRRGSPPFGEWRIQYDRRSGAQYLRTDAYSGCLSNRDRLVLHSDTPGIPFAFEVRLDVAVEAMPYADGHAPYEFGGTAAATLTVGGTALTLPAVGNTPGRRKTGSLVILAAGYPGEERTLAWGGTADDYVETGAARTGGSSASVTNRLWLGLTPPGAGLTSCRPLHTTRAPLPAPRVAYAGVSDGRAVLAWDDCPGGSFYTVERDENGRWAAHGTPVPDTAGSLVFYEPAYASSTNYRYRLLADGTPVSSVTLTAPANPGLSGVDASEAHLEGMRTAVRWQTHLGGLAYACRVWREEDDRWTVLTRGRIPASGLVTLTDSVTTGGTDNFYSLDCAGLGAVGYLYLPVPRFTAWPGEIRLAGNSAPPASLEITLGNYLTGPGRVAIEILGHLPLQQPAVSRLLEARSITTVALPFVPDPSPGSYTGGLRLVVTPAGNAGAPLTFTIPVSMELPTSGQRPAITLFLGPRAGRLEADARLIPHEAATLRLFDALGRLHESLEVTTDTYEPRRVVFGRATPLPAGIYFVRVTQGGQVVVGRGAVVR